MTTMSAAKISMATAPGRKFRITGRCGGRMSRQVGVRIGMGAGCTNLIGDGPGWEMNRGVGLLITTVAGCMQAVAGVGGRVRLTDIRSIVRSGRQLMFRSSEADLESDLD